jgi:hypothetical protein
MPDVADQQELSFEADQNRTNQKLQNGKAAAFLTGRYPRLFKPE